MCDKRCRHFPPRRTDEREQRAIPSLSSLGTQSTIPIRFRSAGNEAGVASCCVREQFGNRNSRLAAPTPTMQWLRRASAACARGTSQVPSRARSRKSSSVVVRGGAFRRGMCPIPPLAEPSVKRPRIAARRMLSVAISACLQEKPFDSHTFLPRVPRSSARGVFPDSPAASSRSFTPVVLVALWAPVACAPGSP